MEQVIRRAQAGLEENGEDASRLAGCTWHGCRHAFASRLVMAGVSLRAVQELGGWRTLGMVQRYAHLSSGYLAEAVERIAAGAVELSRRRGAGSGDHGGRSVS